VKSSHVIETVAGATDIGSATAGNVAVDGSSINSSASSSVNLSGAAEQNAEGINIVNAANSMIANGVNISRIANVSVAPVLTQVNTISQLH
jgi:hypothetical protein